MLNRNVPIDMECPRCHQKFSFTFGNLQKREPVSCPHCGLKLVTAAAEEILANAEKSLKDLKKNVVKAIRADPKS